MKKTAYGTPDPGNDVTPMEAQSSSLLYWKKALSSYMPNRLMTWNVATQQGNPTKSAAVNDLIKKVKKCEVHHVGVPSKARRAAKMNEYHTAMHFLMAKPQNDLMHCYLMPSLMKFQFHMIGGLMIAHNFQWSLLLPTLTMTSCYEQSFVGQRMFMRNVMLQTKY